MLYVVMSWKKTWLNKQNQWVNYKMPWFYSNHCPWVKISGFFFFSSVTVGFIVTESFKSWVIISWNKRSNDLKQITNEQSDNYIVPPEGYKKNPNFHFPPALLNSAMYLSMELWNVYGVLSERLYSDPHALMLTFIFTGPLQFFLKPGLPLLEAWDGSCFWTVLKLAIPQTLLINVGPISIGTINNV